MYPLEALSPTAFEHVVADILEIEHKKRFERFAPGADQGIDARSVDQGIVLQCKRYVRSSYAQLRTACRHESERQSFPPSCKTYLLVTSLPLTVGKKDELIELLRSGMDVNVEVWGNEDVQSRLRTHPAIVRRHAGLLIGETGVLEALLNAEHEGRRYTAFHAIRESARTYVPFPGIKDLEACLEDKGSLILGGPPGIGKTTISHAIIQSCLDQRWELQVARSLHDVYKVLPSDQPTLVWFDDFLGTTRISDVEIGRAGGELPGLLRQFQRSPHRLLLTSRDYMLSTTIQKSDRLTSHLLDPVCKRIDLDCFPMRYREDVLFSHLEAEGVDAQQMTPDLHGQLLRLAAHPDFSPRVISTAVSAAKTEQMSLPETLTAVGKALDDPEDALETIFYQHLEPEHRLLVFCACLAAAFDVNGVTDGVVRQAFVALQGDLGFDLSVEQLDWRYETALGSIQGTFLRKVGEIISLASPGKLDFAVDRLRRHGSVDLVWQFVTTYSDLVRVSAILNLSVHDVLSSERAPDLVIKGAIFRQFETIIGIETDDDYDAWLGENPAGDAELLLDEVARMLGDVCKASPSKRVYSPAEIDLLLSLLTIDADIPRYSGAEILYDLLDWMERQRENGGPYAAIVERITPRMATYIARLTGDWATSDLYCSRPDDLDIDTVIYEYGRLMQWPYLLPSSRDYLCGQADDAVADTTRVVSDLTEDDLRHVIDSAHHLIELFPVSLEALQRAVITARGEAFWNTKGTTLEPAHDIHPDQLSFDNVVGWRTAGSPSGQRDPSD